MDSLHGSTERESANKEQMDVTPTQTDKSISDLQKKFDLRHSTLILQISSMPMSILPKLFMPISPMLVQVLPTLTLPTISLPTSMKKVVTFPMTPVPMLLALDLLPTLLLPTVISETCPQQPCQLHKWQQLQTAVRNPKVTHIGLPPNCATYSANISCQQSAELYYMEKSPVCFKPNTRSNACTQTNILPQSINIVQWIARRVANVLCGF